MPKVKWIGQAARPKPKPIAPHYRQELLKRYAKGRKMTYAALAPLVGVNSNTLRWKFSDAGIDSITANEAFSLFSALEIPMEEAAEAWRRDA